MATTISQRELRNDNAQVMRRVEQGESFVVTRHGTPVADLIPHRPRPERRTLVPIDDLAAGYARLRPINVASWLGDRDALDAVVADDDTDPWAGRH